jgi:hypothetical protein
MKIRSITCFVDLEQPINPAVLPVGARFLSAARPAFVNAGYEVQTARLATVPFPYFTAGLDLPAIVDLVHSLEKAALEQGFEYLSLGPALPDAPASYPILPDLLAATQAAFFSGMLTTSGGGVSLPAVHLCAEIIQRAAPLSPDGFANLRFAALANVPAGSSFFPAAYHSGGPPGFALALQAADLAVEAFSAAASLEEARQSLVEAMQAHAHLLERVALDVEKQSGVKFRGIDFSLAPFPEQALSLGTALERLGVPILGLHGSLAAAAILADTMDRARFHRAGFSGLMLPVLEDAVLAQRAAEGVLSVKDLLLFSAVCGTGLDTVPLPGDVTAEQIYAVLLDLACLAQRLNKPLTARLMPIPGKATGDLTGFDFAFFANSRVLDLQAGELGGVLSGKEILYLQPRSV